MNSRAPGFSLVELLIVAVLSAFIMSAIYQTLTVEQKANRQINAVVATQQTLRTSMQFLQGEFRELGTTTGDITAAAPESLTFRALRKVGLVCSHNADGTIDVYSFGDPFQGGAGGDSVIVYADKGNDAYADDSLLVGFVTAAGNPTSCAPPGGSPWANLGTSTQKLGLALATGTMADFSTGAIIRSYETVTYGIFGKDGSYFLGRRGGAASDTVVKLIGPLAAPAQGGLVLAYYDTLNHPITAANLPASLHVIGRIQVSLRGSTRGAGSSTAPTYSDTLVSNVYLRGNT